MALKILLADDSMTAQNMGKKILADAGFDVVTVSNGAAAIKKISSENPDLIILDVYMPGYNGLEVCERIKAAPETSGKPVLLTVGKMEPFNTQDANRVKAEGLMIKPFEASDLIAAVEAITKKLSPAAKPATPAAAIPAKPETPKPVEVEKAAKARYDDTVQLTPEELEVVQEAEPELPAAPAQPAFTDEIAIPQQAAPKQAAPQPKVEIISDSEPAFSVTSALNLDAEVADIPAASKAAAPANGSHAWESLISPQNDPLASPEDVIARDRAASGPRPSPTKPAKAAVQPTQVAPQLETNQPVAVPEVQVATEPEFEATSLAPVDPVVSAAPELEVTSPVMTVETSSQLDPALVTDPDEIVKFATHFGVDQPTNEEDLVIGIAPELMAEPTSESPHAPSVYQNSDVTSSLLEAEPEITLTEPALETEASTEIEIVESEAEPVVLAADEAPVSLEEPKVVLSPLAQDEPTESSITLDGSSDGEGDLPYAFWSGASTDETSAAPATRSRLAQSKPPVPEAELSDSPNASLVLEPGNGTASKLKPTTAQAVPSNPLMAVNAADIDPDATADLTGKINLQEPEETASRLSFAAAAAAATGAATASLAAHVTKAVAGTQESSIVGEEAIARAVAKVLERMKPDLIAQITRELASEE